MAPRRRRSRIQITVEEDVARKLGQVRGDLRSMVIPKAMHAGAAVMGAPAAAAAPVGETGLLKAGIYITSAYRNNFQQLRRAGNGKALNSPLKNPAKFNQALVINSVYYTRFVEHGRKPRSHNANRGAKHERRGVGKQRKRPFFLRTVRRMRPQALAVIKRRLVRLIEEAWQR